MPEFAGFRNVNISVLAYDYSSVNEIDFNKCGMACGKELALMWNLSQPWKADPYNC